MSHITATTPVTDSRSPSSPAPTILEASLLSDICREAGADDVGFVTLDRPELDGDRETILSALPDAKALIGFVVRMTRAPIRSPERAIANLEFHHTGDRVNAIALQVVRRLEEMGVAAVNPSMGFPMEMDRFPGKIWTVSHKKVAEAAGLGRMGIHRNVIHPVFGNFILLGTVIVGAEIDRYDQPIDFDPCFECKLCVAACPVGAIGADRHFDFSACYTHNYREFMGGFTDWVETIAESGSARGYRRRVSDAESTSMWQSLSFGASYKAAYCMAVCPAGDDVIAPYRENRKEFVATTLKPLQQKPETVYVVPGSDAEAHVAKRFPAKRAKAVGNGLRPQSIEGFLDGLPLTFQRGRSKGVDAVYHFSFTGEEEVEATVEIKDQTLRIQRGHHGKADLRLRADSRTWVRFLAKDQGLVAAILRRKITLRGSPRLLLAFARCFPS